MDYRTRIVSSLAEIGPARWDALVAAQAEGNPFLSYAFLHALHESGSASPESGWEPHYLTLWQGEGQQEQLVAALPLYRKFHSYGEYVFDWAWAEATSGMAWIITPSCSRPSPSRRYAAHA
jgi:predicted N-acyltransferase